MNLKFFPICPFDYYLKFERRNVEIGKIKI